MGDVPERNTALAKTLIEHWEREVVCVGAPGPAPKKPAPLEEIEAPLRRIGAEVPPEEWDKVKDPDEQIAQLKKACRLALDYLDGPATAGHVLSQKRHTAIAALEEALKP